ncbi:MAG: hypothetical protein JST82_05010 [Bacteroidetes bacterium]|nr:hypothetical protein [Bacteroidota bacterium]
MKKIFLLFIALCLGFNSNAQQSFSLQIEAGSLAPWGKSRELKIDNKGKCHYVLYEINKGPIDSADFTISQNELKELSNTINQNGFFKLNKVYATDARDGMGMAISIQDKGKSHKVILNNKHTKEIDNIINKLNDIVGKQNIKIIY